MSDNFPETFEIPVEISTNNGKHLRLLIGIMFKQVTTMAGPAIASCVIFANDLISDYKCTRAEAMVLVTPDVMTSAVESLQWQVHADPDMPQEIRQYITNLVGPYEGS